MRLVMAGLLIGTCCAAAHASDKAFEEQAADQVALMVAKDLCSLQYNEDAVAQFVAATVPLSRMEEFSRTMAGLYLTIRPRLESGSAEQLLTYCKNTKAYAEYNGFTK